MSDFKGKVSCASSDKAIAFPVSTAILSCYKSAARNADGQQQHHRLHNRASLHTALYEVQPCVSSCRKELAVVACSALKQRYRDILTGRESGSDLAEDIAFVSGCMRCRAHLLKLGGVA